MIKNERSQKDIQPKLFRSLKYDCYLYVNLNFGNDLFSTIPLPYWTSFDNPAKIVLYKKGLFLIFVKGNPFEMFTYKSQKLQLDREHKIFVVRVKIDDAELLQDHSKRNNV